MQSGRQDGSKRKRGLTPKQRKFCSEYVVDLNATQAAIRAGYSAKTARSQASDLLTKPDIQEGIREAQKALASTLSITPEKVLKEWGNIAFANMQDFTRVTPEGDPYVDLSECTREQMAALSETQVEDFTEGRGDDARNVRRVKIKFHSKTQALDALSRHLGLFEADNSQRTVIVHDSRGRMPVATAGRPGLEPEEASHGG
jgi:phage terminase small subunit